MGDPWRPGLPSEPCVCEVQPVRDIAMRFQGGERGTWRVGDARLVRIVPYTGQEFWIGTTMGLFTWPGVKNGRVVVAGTNVEWRPVPVPEGVPDA